MRNIKLVSIFLSALLLAPTTFAAGVEVFLKDRLDGNLSEYCIDIMGGFANIDPSRGIQAHTCLGYQGQFGTDQTLDADRFAAGEFIFPEFDVCITLESTEADATASLTSCNDSEAQNIVFTANGNISPESAPNMCLTVGDETSFGRGGTSPHQIRTLTLQGCSDALAARQEWTTRDQPQAE